MRDFRDAKAMAATLRASLATIDIKISVAQSLELIARSFGVVDWNTLAAAIRSYGGGVPQAVPPAQGKPAGLLSPQLEATLNQAFAYAKVHRHDLISPEHLLLSFLDDPEAAPLFKACGIACEAVRAQLTEHLEQDLTVRASGADGPQPTLGLQRILQRAVFHVQSAGRPPVSSCQVLVALFSEKRSRAVTLLNVAGMTRQHAVNYLTHGVSRPASGDAGGSRPTQ